MKFVDDNDDKNNYSNNCCQYRNNFGNFISQSGWTQ